MDELREELPALERSGVPACVQPRDMESLRRLIEAVRETADLESSCAALGMNLKSVRYWLRHVPWFEEELLAAQGEAVGKLKKVVFERARDGWEEPVFYKGEVCGHVRRYDNGLAMRLIEVYDRRFRRRVDFRLSLESEVRRVAAARGLDPAVLMGAVQGEFDEGS